MIDTLLSWVPWLLGIIGGGGIAASILFAFMPTLLTGTVLPFLMGSALGRKIALAFLVLVGVLLVVWRIYAAGGSAERARQAEASLRNIRTRIKVDDEVSSLPVAERRRRLQEWAAD